MVYDDCSLPPLPAEAKPCSPRKKFLRALLPTPALCAMLPAHSLRICASGGKIFAQTATSCCSERQRMTSGNAFTRTSCTRKDTSTRRRANRSCFLTARIAAQTRRAAWEVFSALDEIIQNIAKDADKRLSYILNLS